MNDRSHISNKGKYHSKKQISTLFIAFIVFISCFPYAKRARKEHLIRIAVVCGVDKINISGVVDNRYYRNYPVSSNHTLPVSFRPKEGVVIANGKKYRGYLKIQENGGQLWAINILNIEDYIKGVVPCEIGRISEALIEAAKAQAVAARTYAWAHRNQYQDLGFDLHSTVQDQVYKGIGCESELINLAVDNTKGQILTYKNMPIEAKYHSTCGGRTADFNDAWPGTPPPYLKSVRCSYCKNSPHYEWKSVLSKNEFFVNLRKRLKKVGRKIPDSESIRNLKLIRNRKSKRVIKLMLITEKGEYVVPHYDIRTVLGSRNDPGGLLRSTYISLKSKGDKITIKGKGWGHGVGMCQFGAIEMARKGKTYKQILSHYYRRTRIKKIR